MRVLRRVWDGPFKTPPMTQPITVGWVLLKLFETIWRAFLILCLLTALAILGFWISERNPLSSQIRVELSTSPADCAAKHFPIFAHIENKSAKTIGEVDLQFRVYTQGTSKDVASYLGSHQEMRNIISPGEALDWCFPMPELEAGSTGPYTVAADVTYAAKLSKDIPVSAKAPPIETVSPPPLVRMEAPPGASVRHRRSGPKTLWQSATDLLGVAIMFVLVASGGYALIGLFDRAFRTRLQAGLFDDNKGGERGCLAIGVVGFLNMLIVGSGGSYVLGAIGWDAWLTQFDDWSWAHGLADSGLLLLAALTCQWPWPILLAFQHSRRVQA